MKRMKQTEPMLTHVTHVTYSSPLRFHNSYQELSHRSRLTVMAGSQKNGSLEVGARSDSLYVLRQNGSTTASTCIRSVSQGCSFFSRCPKYSSQLCCPRAMWLKSSTTKFTPASLVNHSDENTVENPGR